MSCQYRILSLALFAADTPSGSMRQLASPTLTERPISYLRFTSTDLPKRGFVKVNLRFENRVFGPVRVGALRRETCLGGHGGRVGALTLTPTGVPQGHPPRTLP